MVAACLSLPLGYGRLHPSSVTCGKAPAPPKHRAHSKPASVGNSPRNGARLRPRALPHTHPTTGSHGARRPAPRRRAGGAAAVAGGTGGAHRPRRARPQVPAAAARPGLLARARCVARVLAGCMRASHRSRTVPARRVALAAAAHARNRHATAARTAVPPRSAPELFVSLTQGQLLREAEIHLSDLSTSSELGRCMS